MLNNNPLVSVVVWTYNSSKTVLETLESVKKQTYPNIELIVSDDCSKDNTVNVCRNWLRENGSRFVRVQLLTVTLNTGTVKNGNRANRAAKGYWIKVLAADDRLLSNCIEDDVDYVLDNPDTDFLFTKIRLFGDEVSSKKWLRLLQDGSFINSLTERQKKILIYHRNFLPAASSFMKSETFWELGGYDERFILLEDWPLWMKAFTLKKKIRFLPKETVEYRVNELSISQSPTNPIYLLDLKKSEAYGHCYTSRMGFFPRVYISSLNSVNKGPWYRIFHSFNVLNPFYWERKKVIGLFNAL